METTEVRLASSIATSWGAGGMITGLSYEGTTLLLA